MDWAFFIMFYILINAFRRSGSLCNVSRLWEISRSVFCVSDAWTVLDLLCVASDSSSPNLFSELAAYSIISAFITADGSSEVRFGAATSTFLVLLSLLLFLLFVLYNASLNVIDLVLVFLLKSSRWEWKEFFCSYLRLLTKDVCELICLLHRASSPLFLLFISG